MGKIWMKFICEKCGLENWIFEDPNSFNKEELIIYCYDCGKVQGIAQSMQKDDKGESCCNCIPFTGTEQGTNGPHGNCPPDNSTIWATVDGKMLTRTQFMKKYGQDPWTDWCKKHPDSPFCVGFEDRCKNHKKPRPSPGPDYIPQTEHDIRPKPR